jgi:DNA-binding transcriptional regulator YiaG
MSRYHYTESGLPNVWIENIDVIVDDAGEAVYEIANIRGLHGAISKAIVESNVGLTGPELRFLRTEMGLTQAELARLVHKDGQTIGRWERGEKSVDENAQTIVRLLAIDSLKLAQRPARDVAESSIPTTTPPEIKIDGSNPAHYRIAA